MYFFGKIIGVILGFKWGGFFGAIAGLILGSIADKNFMRWVLLTQAFLRKKRPDKRFSCKLLLRYLGI